MAAVLTRLRAELRARWRAWGVIALLIGLAGGAVLTTAAGARRTDTAYARFLRWSRGADILVSPNGTGLTGYYDALRRVPEVASFGALVGINLAPVGGAQTAPAIASTDGVVGSVIERPKVVAGRMYDPNRPDEAVVDRLLAPRLHARPGSVLQLQALSDSGTAGTSSPSVTVRVVGPVVTRTDVLSVNALAGFGQLLVTPALYREVGNAFNGYDGAFVRLRPGASRAAFERRAQALAPHFPDINGQVFVADEHAEAAKVERGIRPQAVALALFALLTAITAVFVLGQIVSRQLFVASTENPSLRAMGMTRTQLLALGLAQVVVTSAAGAVLAALIAAIASTTMPIGPARVAEPHPGAAVSWAVLGLGALAVVILIVSRSAWSAWRLAKAPSGTVGTIDAPGAGRPSRLAATATVAGAPPSAAIGLRLALEPGHGRTSVPVRSALAGTALAIAAVAAALTFGANLVHLVRTPRLYGQRWELTVDTQFANIPPGDADPVLRRERGVTGWTYGDHAALLVAGRQIPTIALARGRGPISWPTLLEGRAPEAPGEIVLGTKTLSAVHARVGTTIEATPQGSDRAVPMRVVGRAVFPFFGQGSFAPTDLGEGAAIQDSSPNPAGFNFFLVRLAPGPGRAGAIARLRRDIAPHCPPGNPCNPVTTLRPADILNYARVQGTPLALAAVLAVLAVATLAHLLVTSIRRRRRDLAVLKTLGFVRAQVSAAVAWQATTVVLVSLAVGIPLGVAAGRWTWQFFAGRLGVPANPRVPFLTMLLAIPVALAICNLIAAGPGLVAGRLKPAPVLRSE